MTTSERAPWTSIQVPASGYNVLRVDSDHPHDFFWGKDAAGSCLLILVINEQSREYLEERKLELRGVKSDIRYNQATGDLYFVLSLQQTENADIFHRLCIDLVDCTKSIEQQKVALEIIEARLKRWKKFLSKKGSKLLTPHEVQGLYAELEFLHACLRQPDKQSVSIVGWQGPLDGPHDFVLGNYAVEVKSVSGAQKNTVRISSENQLMTNLDRLFLQVYFLAEFHDCKDGISLNSLVIKVKNEILDVENIEIFENRLAETGYIEIKDYDTPCYKVIQIKCYEVIEGFPRIIPQSLKEGLTNVSYDLALNSLEGYVCESPA